MQTLQAVICRYGRRDDAVELRRRICDELRRKRIRLVVIDDDPTGIQTVHGCLLLTEITAERIAVALEDEAPFFYLLVNSRAMTEQDARRVVREAVEATLEANRERGYNLLFVSRSDSTLRGHFPAESDTMIEVLREQGYEPLMPTLFVPAFFEAGRMTVEGVHYMAQGEQLVPTSETEFARDNVFHYSTSVLSDYIVEKAVEYRLGARALRTICEVIMKEIMFDAPSSNEKHIVITRDYAERCVNRLPLASMQASA